MLQDGVLWITTEEVAGDRLKTAVFDVSDLCSSDEETQELVTAVQHQTGADWIDTTGIGGVIATPKLGTMVIRHTERVLQQVTELLATYRTALKSSKPRPPSRTIRMKCSLATIASTRMWHRAYSL